MMMASEDLRALIWKTFVVSKFPPDSHQREFSPEGTLRRIITINSVWEELANTEEELVDFVLQDAQKVFAIAVFSAIRGDELKETLRKLKEHNVKDQNLPIRSSRAEQHPCFRDLFSQYEFLKNQWSFLAPTFGDIDIVLDLEAVFPFTEVERQTSTEGAFGTVYEVTLHESHCGRNNDLSQVRCLAPLILNASVRE